MERIVRNQLDAGPLLLSRNRKPYTSNQKMDHLFWLDFCILVVKLVDSRINVPLIRKILYGSLNVMCEESFAADSCNNMFLVNTDSGGTIRL
mmetsp:Transcript_21141/g.38265  ORF Transcript_21141/g.38265 Transcript_21141/m.38265 type:complete len:92 (-) Transcript_21141:1306-1581(-)